MPASGTMLRGYSLHRFIFLPTKQLLISSLYSWCNYPESCKSALCQNIKVLYSLYIALSMCCQYV